MLKVAYSWSMTQEYQKAQGKHHLGEWIQDALICIDLYSSTENGWIAQSYSGRSEPGGGARVQLLADQLNLSQPGMRIMPTTLLSSVFRILILRVPSVNRIFPLRLLTAGAISLFLNITGAIAPVAPVLNTPLITWHKKRGKNIKNRAI